MKKKTKRRVKWREGGKKEKRIMGPSRARAAAILRVAGRGALRAAVEMPLNAIAMALVRGLDAVARARARSLRAY
jgi:hypothetical protein